MLKAKNSFFEKRCSNIEIPFFMISNPDFSLFFPVITGTVECWKYRFLTTFFPKSQNTVMKIFISRPPANTTSPPSQIQHFSVPKWPPSSSNLQASIRFLINVYNFFKISIAHYISVLYTSLYLNNHQN